MTAPPNRPGARQRLNLRTGAPNRVNPCREAWRAMSTPPASAATVAAINQTMSQWGRRAGLDASAAASKPTAPMVTPADPTPPQFPRPPWRRGCSAASPRHVSPGPRCEAAAWQEDNGQYHAASSTLLCRVTEHHQTARRQLACGLDRMGSAEGADSIWVSNRPAKCLPELLPHPAAVRFAQSDAEVHSAVYKKPQLRSTP